MIDREDLGSWIGGAPTEPDYVPGSRLGLPAEGPGSVASVPRRFVAYLVDWLLCAGASWIATGGSLQLVWPLFVLVSVVMLSLVGATFGQLALRLRTVPVARRWPMPLRALVRTGLLLLLLPALVFDRDRQPLQDVLAGTAIVRA